MFRCSYLFDFFKWNPYAYRGIVTFPSHTAHSLSYSPVYDRFPGIPWPPRDTDPLTYRIRLLLRVAFRNGVSFLSFISAVTHSRVRHQRRESGLCCWPGRLGWGGRPPPTGAPPQITGWNPSSLGASLSGYLPILRQLLRFQGIWRVFSFFVVFV